MFNNISVVTSLKLKQAQVLLDALTIYLATLYVNSDSISWWKLHHAIYGMPLVHIAQSYLAVPGTSISCI